MSVCKIAKGMCSALFDQMAEKATKVLYPVVESIKALAACDIDFPQSCCQSKTFGYYSLQKLQLLLTALENLSIYPAVVYSNDNPSDC